MRPTTRREGGLKLARSYLLVSERTEARQQSAGRHLHQCGCDRQGLGAGQPDRRRSRASQGLHGRSRPRRPRRPRPSRAPPRPPRRVEAPADGRGRAPRGLHRAGRHGGRQDAGPGRPQQEEEAHQRRDGRQAGRRAKPGAAIKLAPLAHRRAADRRAEAARKPRRRSPTCDCRSTPSRRPAAAAAPSR